jgi:hypothetical protein
MKLVSTTALAKRHQLKTKEMFVKLMNMGLIEKEGASWKLTEEGKRRGGAYKDSQQYGRYIVWPEDLLEDKERRDTSRGSLITATTIGKEFGLSAVKVNYILSEIGWISRGIKGWILSEQGKKQGGVQDEDKHSGVPYVRWPRDIVKSKVLIETIEQFKGGEGENKQKGITDGEKEFRKKFEAKHRTTDGHYVRSKAEMLIDNWLYMAGIVHAYERKLPIEEDVYSDFYIPDGKVYIEYWGYENDEKYQARKRKKIALYKKYGFNLIELTDKDVQNLDDVLPRLLLKYGVKAY